PVDGGHEDDLRPASGGGLGHGVAHLPRRPVPDESDGVDRLPGAAGRHQHPPAGEVADLPGAGGAAGQQGGGRLNDAGGVGQPPGAHVAAGQSAGLGLDDLYTAAAQHGQVVLHGGVFPHLGVHRRGDEDGGPGGQQRRRQQVVGDAGGVVADDPGGGRRHHDEVAGLAEPGVGDRL